MISSKGEVRNQTLEYENEYNDLLFSLKSNILLIALLFFLTFSAQANAGSLILVQWRKFLFWKTLAPIIGFLCQNMTLAFRNNTHVVFKRLI